MHCSGLFKRWGTPRKKPSNSMWVCWKEMSTWLHRYFLPHQPGHALQHLPLQNRKCQFCDKLIHHFNWLLIAEAQLLQNMTLTCSSLITRYFGLLLCFSAFKYSHLMATFLSFGNWWWVVLNVFCVVIRNYSNIKIMITIYHNIFIYRHIVHT